MSMPASRNWSGLWTPRSNRYFRIISESDMQIGIIGLGKMGGNMSRRLMKAGHSCVVFDANAKPRDALAKEGALAAQSLGDSSSSSTKSHARYG